MEPKRIVAIDPGPVRSAWVVYDGEISGFAMETNERILQTFQWGLDQTLKGAERLVIENVTARIHPVRLADGKTAFAGHPAQTSTLETMYWVGVFSQAFGRSVTHRINRLDVKKHVCGSAAAKDADVRRALIQRWFERTGNPQPERKGGPLYGVTKDVWSALAIAVTWWETGKEWV